MAKKDLVSPKTLKGFRDSDPQLSLRRKAMVDHIWQQGMLAGFEPIETPVLEYAETLLGSGGDEADKEVYLFEDHGSRKVGLRFDLTVPFSRYVAANQGTLVMPFKRVQIGNSYRGEKPQKGRYREFCQADVDIVGVDSMAADIEVMQNITGNLKSFIPESFSFLMGHRIVLSAVIKAALPDLSEEGELKTLIAIDKLAKIGSDAVAEIMAKIDGTSAEGIQSLLKVITAKDAHGDSELGLVQELLAGNDKATRELKRLSETHRILKDLVADDQLTVRLDLSIARGLGYYTGVVFETFIDSLPGFGSVSSGGRYNGLVSRFSKQEIPGIGGSIGVDRLLAALDELGHEPKESRQGIFIAVADEEARGYGFQIAKQIRSMGQKADIALKPGKLANQFKYADRKFYSKVITIGQLELDKNNFSIKDLSNGQEEKDVPLADLGKHCQ